MLIVICTFSRLEEQELKTPFLDKLPKVIFLTSLTFIMISTFFYHSSFPLSQMLLSFLIFCTIAMNCRDGLYFYIAICVSKSASRVFLKGEYETPIFFFLLDPGHVHCLVYLLLKFICALSWAVFHSTSAACY